MARMPRVFRLLAGWTLIAIIVGSDTHWAIGAGSSGVASETSPAPWPNSAAVYQPPPPPKPVESGVMPATSTIRDAYVQPTAYVAGPTIHGKAAASDSPAPLPPTVTAPAPVADVASSTSTGKSPLLPPPSRRIDPAQSQAAGQSAPARSSMLPPLFTLLGSLAVVIALFLAAAWLLRRTTGGNLPTLPKDVVEVLGRVPLASRQQVHLLRVGHKLLLVAVSQAGMETLTEITEGAEVDRLAGLCQQTRSDSATSVFRNVLHQVGVQTASRRRVPTDELRLANLSVPQYVDEYEESRHA
jgi:flagellar biogenesis protein FliO